MKKSHISSSLSLCFTPFSVITKLTQYAAGKDCQC